MIASTWYKIFISLIVRTLGYDNVHSFLSVVTSNVFYDWQVIYGLFIHCTDFFPGFDSFYDPKYIFSDDTKRFVNTLYIISLVYY
jgi:hypothetical protein